MSKHELTKEQFVNTRSTKSLKMVVTAAAGIMNSLILQ